MCIFTSDIYAADTLSSVSKDTASVVADSVSASNNIVVVSGDSISIDSLEKVYLSLKASLPANSSGSFYLYMLIAVLLGYLAHVIFTTVQAIKNKTTTPNYFSLNYWFKDNALSKLSAVLTFALGLPFLTSAISTYATVWYYKILFLLLGFVIGLFIDFIYSKLQMLSRLKS